MLVSDKSRVNIREKLEELSGSGTPDINIMRFVADELGVPLSAVKSVASYYDSPDRSVHVCTGLPCSLARDSHSSGGEHHEVSCMGYCDHAPVRAVNGRYFHEGGKDMREIEESRYDYVMNNRQDIASYTSAGGYAALEAILSGDPGFSVMERLESSGISGMGGAGFPAHLKWKSFRSSRKNGSYLLVNGHEGEPGTFKDREIMEIFPHSVLEGAFIAALSNGIEKIVLAVKREYLNAYTSLVRALDELAVTFGNNGTLDTLPPVDLKLVGGSYATGEETALMEAVEGRRGEPRLRPPFPTERGLYGKPTLVHNAETLSAIPGILGAEESPIRKRYCLTGDVEKRGSYRATQPTARDLLYEYGNSDISRIRAFMPGGLSGGILPATDLDVRLDRESLRKRGASPGTGAMITISEDRCMVDVSERIARFFRDESCGKCAPCRLGTAAITRFLGSLRQGGAGPSDMEDARRIAGTMMDGSICALGQAAGRMFLDSVKYFRDEYEEHMGGSCRTGVCMDGDAR